MIPLLIDVPAAEIFKAARLRSTGDCTVAVPLFDPQFIEPPTLHVRMLPVAIVEFYRRGPNRHCRMVSRPEVTPEMRRRCLRHRMAVTPPFQGFQEITIGEAYKLLRDKS